MKKTDCLRYISGACYASVALEYAVEIVRYGRYGFDFLQIILVVGYAVIAVSVLASVPVLTTVGSVLCLINSTREILSNYGFKCLFFCKVALAAYWAIFVIVGINKNDNRILGVTAAIVAAVRLVLWCIWQQSVFREIDFSLYMWFSFFAIIVGALTFGISVDGAARWPKAEPKRQNGKRNNNSKESNIERLTKLKKLLDMEVITQEEFEAKKKEILK